MAVKNYAESLFAYYLFLKMELVNIRLICHRQSGMNYSILIEYGENSKDLFWVQMLEKYVDSIAANSGN